MEIYISNFYATTLENTNVGGGWVGGIVTAPETWLCVPGHLHMHNYAHVWHTSVTA